MLKRSGPDLRLLMSQVFPVEGMISAIQMLAQGLHDLQDRAQALSHRRIYKGDETVQVEVAQVARAVQLAVSQLTKCRRS